MGQILVLKQILVNHFLKCIEKYKRLYLDIDYVKKEYAKTLGGKWGDEKKKWYKTQLFGFAVGVITCIFLIK